MIRLGIPNRSSFLHVSAIAQCIALGLIDIRDYHPAKLIYKSDTAEIVLTRSESLCKMLESNRLDGIFSGGDYAEEFLSQTFSTVPVDIFTVSYALLGPSETHSIYQSTSPIIYTKFPETARKYLQLWGVDCETILPVGGGTEAYVCIGEGLAFDVICTGISVAKNNLIVMHRSKPLTPLWLFGPGAGDFLRNPEQQATLERILPALRGYSQEHLAQRDNEMAAKVGTLLRFSGVVSSPAIST